MFFYFAVNFTEPVECKLFSECVLSDKLSKAFEDLYTKPFEIHRHVLKLLIESHDILITQGDGVDMDIFAPHLYLSALPILGESASPREIIVIVTPDRCDPAPFLRPAEQFMHKLMDDHTVFKNYIFSKWTNDCPVQLYHNTVSVVIVTQSHLKCLSELCNTQNIRAGTFIIHNLDAQLQQISTEKEIQSSIDLFQPERIICLATQYTEKVKSFCERTLTTQPLLMRTDVDFNNEYLTIQETTNFLLSKSKGPTILNSHPASFGGPHSKRDQDRPRQDKFSNVSLKEREMPDSRENKDVVKHFGGVNQHSSQPSLSTQQSGSDKYSTSSSIRPPVRSGNSSALTTNPSAPGISSVFNKAMASVNLQPANNSQTASVNLNDNSNITPIQNNSAKSTSNNSINEGFNVSGAVNSRGNLNKNNENSASIPNQSDSGRIHHSGRNAGNNNSNLNGNSNNPTISHTRSGNLNSFNAKDGNKSFTSTSNPNITANNNSNVSDVRSSGNSNTRSSIADNRRDINSYSGSNNNYSTANSNFNKRNDDRNGGNSGYRRNHQSLREDNEDPSYHSEKGGHGNYRRGDMNDGHRSGGFWDGPKRARNT